MDFKKILPTLRNEKGQGIMEYIIIASLVGVLCLGVVSRFGGVLKGKVENMTEKIRKGLDFRRIGR